MDSFPRLVMSLPEDFEIVENNEEELEDGYGGGAVGMKFPKFEHDINHNRYAHRKSGRVFYNFTKLNF